MELHRNGLLVLDIHYSPRREKGFDGAESGEEESGGKYAVDGEKLDNKIDTASRLRSFLAQRVAS